MDNAIPIEKQTLVCPSCGARRLVGYNCDAGIAVDYDPYFLRTLVTDAGDRLIDYRDTLLSLGHFVCPRDLFTISVPAAAPPEEPCGENRRVRSVCRLNRGKDRTAQGQRIRFFVSALLDNGLDPRVLGPGESAPAETADVFLDVWRLLHACMEVRSDPADIHRMFETLHEDLRWDPLGRLIPDFHRNALFVRSLLELQLADMVYLLRRTMTSHPHYPAHSGLGEILTRLKNLSQHVRTLDVDLMGEILFQCLKLAHFSNGPWARLYLECAYQISGYVLRSNLRVGGGINEHLDDLHRNPDVQLYLHLRLAADLGIQSEDEPSLVGFLEKRLRTVEEYQAAGNDKRQARVVHIGERVKRFYEHLRPGEYQEHAEHA